ncbi:MAG: uracil phosphoribosyltransferase [Bacillota bacterium]|uniref:uracil phosphoribosyltransferase n=1 Tax=Desulfurispora thermophila TaxID=265470 RepID=UPI000378AB57|nr:uracil phosphoribosyltransferase [Desulfurispora thermophila]
MQTVTVLRHPVVADKLRTLRDRHTSIHAFRSALKGLGFFLAMEATKTLPAVDAPVYTPLDVEAPATKIKSERVLLVPILRAGLGLVDSFLEFLPAARVAHIGISRDHETLQARAYLCSLPENPADFDRVFVLDPMLATGNSSVKTLDLIMEAGYSPEKITLVCAFAVEQGINQIIKKYPQVSIVTATIDPQLNEKGYIVPGLGDAGDRLFLI